MAGLTEAAEKSFFSTLKGIGTDKAVSEALLGGAAGVGGNLAYNTVTGDSGGYTGAALMGGAAGGLGRAGLKHFNLEEQASNLFSTFKKGAVGGLTQAKQVAGVKSNKPAGQRIMHGRQEAPISAYEEAIATSTAKGNKLRDKGYVTQAQEEFDKSKAFNIQRKENVRMQRQQSGLSNESVAPTRSAIDPQALKNSPEARAVAQERSSRRTFSDSLETNKQTAQQKFSRNKELAAAEQQQANLNSPPRPERQRITPEAIQGSSLVSTMNTSDNFMRSAPKADVLNYKRDVSAQTKGALTKNLNGGVSKKELSNIAKADRSKQKKNDKLLRDFTQHVKSKSYHQFT